MASAAWRSARPRTPRPPRGSAAEAMIRRHGMHEKLGRQFAHCSTTALGYAPKLMSRPSLLLVHLFPKPVPKFTIDFIDCTAHGVAFFWIYQLSVHAKNYSKSSCSIVSLVSKISCSLRSRRFRVPRRRFSCRGHLTRTEGRDGASPPREGRSDQKAIMTPKNT